MDYTTLNLGIIALVSGLILRYWINRRKFYRRSPLGSEGFSNYEKSVLIRFFEWIGKWIAYALIILGILFLWNYSRQKSAIEKIVKTEKSSTQKFSNFTFGAIIFV